MTPGEIVAQVAHELLDAGPMGHRARPEVYRAFIDANFDDSLAEPVYGSGGTNCAIFVRGCLVQAGILPRGRRPKRPAITTWLGVRGFVEDDPDTEAIEGAWIPVEELGADGELIETGDVPYWAGYRWQKTAALWKPMTNGHVGLVGFDGAGWSRTTYEGGGPAHRCQKSATPKDIRESHQRPLRGVWRPALMLSPSIAADDARTPLDGFLELRRGMHGVRVGDWQVRLLKLGYTLPSGADSKFGGETEGATRAFQRDRHLPNTGIVDRRTWETARAATEPAMQAVCPESR